MIENKVSNLQLGSTILVDTWEYLQLIFSQPCYECSENILENKKFKFQSARFIIKSVIKCIICQHKNNYSNKSSNINFSSTMAAAVAGIFCAGLYTSIESTINLEEKIFKEIAIVTQTYAWSGEPIPIICKRCNNCLRHSQDKLELQNVFNEIKEILDIVEMLCANFTKEIQPTDVVDVFHHNQNASVQKEGFNELLFYTDPIKSSKPKILKNSDLTTLALTDLVVHGL
ncbi:7635_t:CDS:2, partial [Cetraspora pellucida]